MRAFYAPVGHDANVSSGGDLAIPIEPDTRWPVHPRLHQTLITLVVNPDGEVRWLLYHVPG